MHSLSTKIFPKTKRGGAKNGKSPLLIRSEMEISNRGQMPVDVFVLLFVNTSVKGDKWVYVYKEITERQFDLFFHLYTQFIIFMSV